MSEKPAPRNEDIVCVDIPTGLYERVDDYCKSKGITPDEFIFDAVSEKLSSVHRERRRKPRL